MNYTQSERLKPQQLWPLKIASVFEACTLLALVLIAVPLKHLGGWPTGVRVLGPLHGLAFVTYLWVVLQTAGEAQWPRRDSVRLIVMAFVPFGGFINLPFLSRKPNAFEDGALERR